MIITYNKNLEVLEVRRNKRKPIILKAMLVRDRTSSCGKCVLYDFCDDLNICGKFMIPILAHFEKIPVPVKSLTPR